jgi:hypothetical protein
LQNPGLQHFEAIRKCYNYLKAIKHYTLELRTLYIKHPIFVVASNAAYADNLITRQSTKGLIFLAIERYNRLVKQEVSYSNYINC